MFGAEAQEVIQPDNVREDCTDRVSGVICRMRVAGQVQDVICCAVKTLKGVIYVMRCEGEVLVVHVAGESCVSFCRVPAKSVNLAVEAFMKILVHEHINNERPD